MLELIDDYYLLNLKKIYKNWFDQKPIHVKLCTILRIFSELCVLTVIDEIRYSIKSCTYRKTLFPFLLYLYIPTKYDS